MKIIDKENDAVYEQLPDENENFEQESGNLEAGDELSDDEDKDIDYNEAEAEKGELHGPANGLVGQPDPDDDGNDDAA